MIRGEVYDARLDPTEDSEQAGFRPAIIVSRNAINAALSIVVAVPCTSYRPGRRRYPSRVLPSRVLLHPPEGGLTVDSLALCEQVRALSTTRLGRRRGVLSPAALAQVDEALAIALDLPGAS